MSLADDLKPIALEVLGQGIGAALREFTEREPDAATKAKAVAQSLAQVLDALPIEELRPHLTDEDAARAELALLVAKAARTKA